MGFSGGGVVVVVIVERRWTFPSVMTMVEKKGRREMENLEKKEEASCERNADA